MSISSLTWLWGAFVNDYALFFHIGPVTLEHLGLWLEISTSVNLSKADSTFGIRLSRMAICFFSHVFEFAQPDFTRKDVTVNGVIRTCPDLTGYLWIFLWLRHVIFIAILMSSKILVNVPSHGFTASICPILRVTCRHVLRKDGKHKESKHGERKREHMEMMLSIHWRMTHGLSVSHTSHSITRNTLSFELSLLFSCFYCPFFLKRNVLFENFFLQNNWKHCFSFTQLDIREEHEKYEIFYSQENHFFHMRRRLHDWKLSWSLPRAVTLLSELSPRTISCHWSRPRDIRYIEPSLFLCSFFFLKKKQEEDTRKRSWAEKRKLNKKISRKVEKHFSETK